MNELQVFSSPEFGKIRTLTIDSEPWFVGKDVAVALGYESPRAAVVKRVDDCDKGVSEMETLGGRQQMTIINESGLYDLIFGSKLESAKRFKHWVTHDVLPAIRKTGAYAVKPPTDRPLTMDDYMKAVECISKCHNHRLPYVIGILEQLGFKIPELPVEVKPVEPEIDCSIILPKLNQKRMSQGDLSRKTGIPLTAINYYCRGVHKPTLARYKMILKALDE